MDLRLLGPLEARADDGPIELGARKQRAVLAMLALEVGRAVSVDRLVEGLWGEMPPSSAPKMVQLYVSRLRRVLDGNGSCIVTRGRGYELQLPEDAVDVVRFERLLDTRPREALALWRGAPLADLADEPFAAAEIRRLEELRLRAMELAIDADLAAGRHAEVIGELDALVVQAPLRERLRAQRMLALYRSGRQADALEAYRDAREALVELGIEPGEELRALHQAILEHDPRIAAPPAAAISVSEREDGEVPAAPSHGRWSARSRRRPLIVAGALAAIAAGVAVFWPDREAEVAAVRSNAVAEIDPGDGSLGGQAALDGPPSAIAVGPDAIWVAGDRDGVVSRIDPETHTVRDTVPVGHGQSTLAADRGGVWAANRDDGVVKRISRATNDVVDRVSAVSPTHICLLSGELWIAGGTAGGVLRYDPETRGRPRSVPLGESPTALACGAGAVWAVVGERLMRIDPTTGLARRAGDVGAGVSAIAVADRVVWVANPLTGIVSRVDPDRGAVRDFTFGADDEPVALAVGAGGVWVANRGARTVARIDPQRTVGTEEFRLGRDPRALAVVDGRLWVAVAATGAGQRGGTLRVDFQGEREVFGRDKYDPATSYATWGWQVLSTTNDGLTTYRRAGGVAGATLLPNLADTVPTPSDGGLTYAFTLRRGVRFSTGQPVRPSDVKRGIERSLRSESRAFGQLSGIAWITPDDAKGTIVFRLKRPDPDFVYRLATPFASAVPPGTPPPPAVVAATGPYRIAALEPGRRIRLERNRFYRPWSALARPDGYPDAIDARLGVKVGEAIDSVRAGRRDVTVMGTGYEELVRLRRRDPGPIRDALVPATTWVFLNTRVPPFNDVDARRAVSLAIDRRAVVAAAGGKDVVRCHIIPLGLSGYRPGCPPGGPDLAGARRLVARSETRGARVTVWSGSGFEPLTGVLTRTLRSLGYRTRVRSLLFDPYFARVADPRTRAQIGSDVWQADYPRTSNFLERFSCRSFKPRSAENSNISQFCDPGADALMRRATAMQATDPRAADALWARADRRLLAAAPVIPVLSPVHTDLVSKRVRNDQYHAQWGLLLDQVSVR